MTQYYIYRHLPSENQDMLDGARIVGIDNANFPLKHDIKVGEGPFENLKELKRNSVIYNELLKTDRKRAEKIVLEKFIIQNASPIFFPKGLDPEYEKVIYRIMQHSRSGSVNRKSASGFHLYDSKKIRLLNLTGGKNKQGLFKAEIEVFNDRTGKWIKKDSETTFFPTDWNLQNLIIECFQAFTQRKKESETEYSGRTKSGIKVIFQYSRDGKFRTVYPIYE